MWDKRYAAPGYLFGTEPAIFLKTYSDYLIAGETALAVADGEGRNSVFMAGKGLGVTAMDGSPVAVDKARELAISKNVDVDFSVADVLTWEWDKGDFDLVVGIFIQFVGPEKRGQMLRGMTQCLKPGGIILLHGYTPEQLEFGTGGPPFVENMYTENMLRAIFDDFDIITLKSYHQEVQEGRGHSGMSALIDLVARKPI